MAPNTPPEGLDYHYKLILVRKVAPYSFARGRPKVVSGTGPW